MQTTEIVIVRDKLRAGMPTALLIVGSEPLEKLLEFFRERGLALSTERAYAQAIGRFVEWLSVRAEEFHEKSLRSSLYRAFASDLRLGTLQNGVDRYGLNWRPTSDSNLKRICKLLMEFSDWLNSRYGTTLINPIHNIASPTDQLMFWRRWNKQKSHSLLAHTKSRINAREASYSTRSLRLPRGRNKLAIDTKAFPEDRIQDLLWKGFLKGKGATESKLSLKYNLRDILITLLCLYGGCRASEPLHLWADDVYVDPKDNEVALVFIHEPSDGIIKYQDPITGKSKKTSRADFLQRYCGGKKPLTQESGRRHAGWKGALLTDGDRKAFQIHWIDVNAGKLFLTLWRIYLLEVRVTKTQTPWAFLTKDGFPLGFKGYEDSFEAAVKRIGLTPSKHFGTTTHGLRHRYGQLLTKMGLGEKEGQIAMHHLNAKSQDVYRQMSVAQVTEAINKLSGTNSNILIGPP